MDPITEEANALLRQIAADGRLPLEIRAGALREICRRGGVEFVGDYEAEEAARLVSLMTIGQRDMIWWILRHRAFDDARHLLEIARTLTTHM